MNRPDVGDSGAHRVRTVAAMDAADLDLLLLGREANARYVSGANRLWLAGTRPFAPGCAVVRATGEVHLLSITDDGIPGDIPASHLFPITWNPMTMLGAVVDAAGAAPVRRIGVDQMSPLFEALLGLTFTDAELVDAESLLRDVRRVKSDADLDAMRAAARVARDAVEQTLRVQGDRGAVLEAMAGAGVTTPSFTPAVCTAGDRSSIRAGVIRDGWEAVVARHRPVDESLVAAAARATDAVRAGARVGDLRSSGITVDGVGLGHEELADTMVLEPGMTVVVMITAPDGIEHGDTLAVTATAPEVLTA